VAATPSVKIVKSTSYKGNPKTWTNRYHFNGGTPADLAHWNTLFDNIVAAEKAIHWSGTVITEAIGYAAGSDVPVASKTYSTAGTLSSTGITVPVVMAILIRWATTARTAKNHPVYLFSYVHGATRSSASGDLEVVDPAQQTACETFATAWISGFSDGVNTYVRAGPNGASAVARVVSGFLTHRVFRN
jgi:hypothetical protein